jgi:hypothetical protein
VITFSLSKVLISPWVKAPIVCKSSSSFSASIYYSHMIFEFRKHV